MKLLIRIGIVCIAASVYGQEWPPDSIPALMARQLEMFPQEKIYLHTDKPYYVAGEHIWFRAHLADAVSHIPAPVSRYVYVEMINPLDSVVVRLKIRPDSSVYHGYVPVPDDVPEGDYELRAYTSFMRSAGENYFFRKNVRIFHPQSRQLHSSVRFTFESDKRISAEIQLTQLRPTAPFYPENVKITAGNGKTITVKPDRNNALQCTFTLPPDAPRRFLLLETVINRYLYRKFIEVPHPGKEFDLSFYPEGGVLLQGIPAKVAFKALKKDGRAADVTGKVFDSDGTEMNTFKSDHLGMGCITVICAAGKSCYAEAVCDSVTLRFDLPAPVAEGYALSATWMKKRLSVSVLAPDGIKDKLWLTAHTRGIVHFTLPWDPSLPYILLPKESFPSGVLHLLLTDEQMNTLSERLVFVDNEDQAQTAFHPDREKYSARTRVDNRITITDAAGNPLSGSFSVAVTDDHDVQTDTAVNILTSLLLASDLRGNIENPAFYFHRGNRYVWALDLLMMTQGWRRYNLPEVIKGKYTTPTSYLEIGPELSGTVKSVLVGKPQEGITVNVLGMNNPYFETTVTDAEGRFFFRHGELPDSTRFLVNALPTKSTRRLEVILNEDLYPLRAIAPPPAPPADNRSLTAGYVDKTEQKYINEKGMRMYYLEEVTITAERKPPRKSDYYSQADNSLTEDQIDKIPLTNIYNLLMRLPGVMVSGNQVSIRGQGNPLLMVDGVTMDIGELESINVMDVAQVDVLKSASNTAMFGSQGGNGVIVIFTKEGKVSFKPRPFHVKTATPLGYQKPAEFYAPKYDAPSSGNAPPDLRTTIHWQPDVRTDSTGVATFSFYTSDAASTYSVVMEGLTADGKIIRQEGKVTNDIR
ncbi:MAG: TonB-dependent receptor plug domain-containing protein [Bacteroidales bacterium]|jgi:TonB-dependent SusC/RagA subfamily outer membrane receptor|nr:TonB-dependent receptor plug domain-containing protein [Bacteroidales bacterium]